MRNGPSNRCSIHHRKPGSIRRTMAIAGGFSSLFTPCLASLAAPGVQTAPTAASTTLVAATAGGLIGLAGMGLDML